MKLMETLKEIGDMGNSVNEKQKQISVTEVSNLWNMLIARYDAIDLTNFLKKHTDDKDLKLILNEGLDILNSQATRLEKILNKYGVPLTDKPVASGSPSVEIETLTDEKIFREVLRGMQQFLPFEARNFQTSVDPEVRNIFKNLMLEEMELYDNYMEYGKLKGWIHQPPVYRI